jgi:hypothetical protein
VTAPQDFFVIHVIVIALLLNDRVSPGSCIMPYKLEWHQEHRIVYFDLLGEVSTADLEEACVHIRDEYLEKGVAPVHLIVNAYGLDSHPTDIRVIHRTTRIYANHENIGWVIIVGVQNRTSVFFANIVLQSVKRNFRLVASIDEAKEVIKRVNIGWSTPSP